MPTMLDGRGRRYRVEAIDDEAQDWLDHGFAATDAREWCEIDIWDAALAGEFRDAGLSPKEVADAEAALIDAETAAWDAIDAAAAYADAEHWSPCARDSRYTDGPIWSVCTGDTEAQVIIDAAKSL